MYTRCQIQPLCLHGSMTMFAVQQIDAGGILITKKAAGNPAAWKLRAPKEEFVMPGLVPGIHVFAESQQEKT